MTEIAGILQVTPSEVEAVSTFYSMYFQRPHGRHEVIVCINVSCALRGADDIVDHLERSSACKSGETTADGEFTWSSTVECLGGCGGAPTMQVDHHFEENLTPERVDAVLGALQATCARAGASTRGRRAGRRLARRDARSQTTRRQRPVRLRPQNGEARPRDDRTRGTTDDAQGGAEATNKTPSQGGPVGCSGQWIELQEPRRALDG